MDKNQKMYKSAILWAKKHGFVKIKANTEEYETPNGFTRPGVDEKLIPDISGSRLGSKSYVEIALKTDETQNQVSKWQLLSTMAKMKDGSFFLLAPKGHKAYTDKMVKQYNINATVVGI